MPLPAPPTPVDPTLSETQRYQVVRAQIEFEDGLIAQRTNWFVVSQSFLFSAYAITLNAPVQPAWPNFRSQQHVLFHLIPVIALGCCLLIYAALFAGILAQVNLRRHIQTNFSASHLAQYPSIQGAALTRVLGLSAPLGLPLIFGSVWTYLFVSGFQ